jgi:hypothetical protein
MKKKFILIGVILFVLYFGVTNCRKTACNDINAIGCICNSQKKILIPGAPRQKSLESYCIDSCRNEGGFLNYICGK